MATQALLKSLCYDTRGQDTVQQTKAGLPYYDGNPYDFEQWHFVVMGKYDAYASKRDIDVRDQDRIELSVKVIEGLKDDALTNRPVTLENAQAGNGPRVDAVMVFSQGAVSHGRD